MWECRKTYLYKYRLDRVIDLKYIHTYIYVNYKMCVPANWMLYNERRALILPPKMPLWHTDYFEIQLHKKWMMKQENIKDMQKLFGKQIHQTVFIKIFDNFTCLCSNLLNAKLLELAGLLTGTRTWISRTTQEARTILNVCHSNTNPEVIQYLGAVTKWFS